jgi:hypothetical protein
VSIKFDEKEDEHGQRSLGYIMFENPKSQDEWNQLSILNPNEFNTFFKDDFTKLAGLVAERIYHGRFNYKSSNEDFCQWVGTSLPGIKISSSGNCFQTTGNWQIWQNIGNVIHRR